MNEKSCSIFQHFLSNIHFQIEQPPHAFNVKHVQKFHGYKKTPFHMLSTLNMFRSFMDTKKNPIPYAFDVKHVQKFRGYKKKPPFHMLSTLNMFKGFVDTKKNNLHKLSTLNMFTGFVDTKKNNLHRYNIHIFIFPAKSCL